MKHLSLAGAPITILMEGGDTENVYTLLESVLRPGGGIPPHQHEREDEEFLVMRGEITFYIGNQTSVLEQGEHLFAPRGVPHHYVNTGETEAILRIKATPAGIERFYLEAGTPLLEDSAKQIPLTPEGIVNLIQIAKKYGIEILGM